MVAKEDSEQLLGNYLLSQGLSFHFFPPPYCQTLNVRTREIK